MRLSIFNFKKQRWPAGFFLCLAMVCITELVVRHYLLGLLPLSEAVIREKHRRITSATPHPYNAVILGDSHAMSLNAKYISDYLRSHTGKEREMFNFALPSMGMHSYYFLLKQYLSHHPKPEWIVFVSDPLTVLEQWDIQNRPESHYRFCSLFSLKDSWDAFSFPVFMHSLRITLEQQSKLLLYRKRIQLVLKTPWLYKDVYSPLEAFYQRSGGGNFIAPRTPPDQNLVETSDYYNVDFNPDPDFVYWYKKFLALAEARQIKVIILNAPVEARVYAKREADGFNARYRQFVTKTTQDFKNVFVVEPFLRWPFPTELYNRDFHVNTPGARRYTFAVAQELRRIMTFPEEKKPPFL